MSSTIRYEASTGITANTAVVGTGSTTVGYQEQVVTSSTARMALAVGRIVTGFMFLVGLRRQVARPRFHHPD